MKILKQGAEAILYKKGNNLVKERIKKSYRINDIDNRLRKSRTKRETKLLNSVDFSPNVLNVDENKIEMEFVNGKLLKDVLDKMSSGEREKVCRLIGKQIAELHNRDIVHGDLTTSNMLLKKDKLFFIDFGLGFVSKKVEDKAVDLYLLNRALESKHYEHAEESFKDILHGYEECKFYKEVLERLEKVSTRGRYKRKV